MLSDPSLPGGIALDLENDKIYWTGGNWNDTATAPIVLRANMDGSNVETLVNGTVGGETICCNMGIALDVPNEKIYWMSEYYNGYVMQSDLDGHNPKKIANTTGIAANIAVDSAGQWIYWVEYGNSSGQDRIMRASLNGSNVQTLILGDQAQIIQPRSIALDVAGGKMYVADVWGNKVVQANLNGTGVTIFTSGIKDAYGLALDGPNPCTYQ